MKNHITSAREFMEDGILLKGGGQHTVRVLGAHKEVVIEQGSRSKEEIAESLESVNFDDYYAGTAPGPPDDPEAEPSVPPAIVTRDNKVVYLKRDWG